MILGDPLVSHETVMSWYLVVCLCSGVIDRFFQKVYMQALTHIYMLVKI
jgi:hypothetical protein